MHRVPEPGQPAAAPPREAKAAAERMRRAAYHLVEAALLDAGRESLIPRMRNAISRSEVEQILSMAGLRGRVMTITSRTLRAACVRSLPPSGPSADARIQSVV